MTDVHIHRMLCGDEEREGRCRIKKKRVNYGDELTQVDMYMMNEKNVNDIFICGVERRGIDVRGKISVVETGKRENR